MKKYLIRPGEFLKVGTHNYICFREEDLEETVNDIVNKVTYNIDEFTEPNGDVDGSLIYDYIINKFRK